MKTKFSAVIFTTTLLFLTTFSVKKLIAQSHPSKPNVIVILTDDLGYGDLSCYGAKQIETPNVDKIAKEGLRFTNAHSMASTCTPSRFTILTGEYAFRQNNAHILPGNAALLISPNQATLGTIFQKAGYHTADIGKWHVGLGPKGGPDWNGKIAPGPNEVGFNYSFIFPATADRVPTIFVENHHTIALDTADPITVSYSHKVGNDPTGAEDPWLLKMKSTPGQGHLGTIVNGIARIGWMEGGHRARWVDEELGDDFFEQVQSFIIKNQHHPFFIYYAMNEIHVPRMPDPRFKGKSKLGYRGDVILEMDYFVGKLLQTLDWLHLEKNTLIIFTSDNGPVLNDGYEDGSVTMDHGHKPAGPFSGGKYSMLEGGTRMPFIVKWPGVVKPGVSDAMISQADLLASFAAMLHVKLRPQDGVDSKDELKAILGKSKTGRKTLVEQNNDGVLALIDGNWKYIEPHPGPALFKEVNIASGLSLQPQLYDLRNDIGEKHNLASQYPDKVKQMSELLQKIKDSGHTRY